MKNSSFCLFLITLSVFALTSCSKTVNEERNHSTDTEKQIDSTIYRAVIDTESVSGKFDRALLGTNWEWFNNANGLADKAGNIHPDWIKLARAQQLDHIRFPGGTLSDFYDWKNGIGPINERPIIEHPTDPGRSSNQIGTPEFLRFCETVGARPLITVNVGTGTAEMAAEWLAYTNQKDHPLRLKDGIPEPADVMLWEIGNEVYLPGNPDDKKIITMRPEVYAEKYLEYASAMRAIDPRIQLMGIGTANSTEFPLPFPEWNEIVLSAAAHEMNYYAIHNAYFPMVFNLKNLETLSLYKALWASPEAVKSSLIKLDALIAQHEGDRRVEIAITEWGSLFSFDKQWIDHVGTLGSAVYLGRLMQVFSELPRVTFASYFKFADRNFMGWIGHNRVPKVPYYVIELFAKYTGPTLVKTELTTPTFDTERLGIMMAQNDVETLTALSSLSDTGDMLYFNIISRSPDTWHLVELDTGSFTSESIANAYFIYSPGITDHNQTGMGPEFPKSFYEQAPLSSPDLQHINIGETEVDITQPIQVPPHSILTLAIKRQPTTQ